MDLSDRNKSNVEISTNGNIVDSITLSISDAELNVNGLTEESKGLASGIEKCKYCYKQLSELETWQDHEQTHTGERPYLCIPCGMTFQQDSTLRGHTNYHNATSEPEKGTYPCGVCGENLYSVNELREHTSVHAVEWPVECTLCMGRFTSTIYLTYHRNAFHSNRRNIVCTICSKKFGKRKHQLQHMVQHSDEKPSKCTKCDKAYTRKSSLNAHILKVHAGNSIDSDQDDSLDILLKREVPITGDGKDNRIGIEMTDVWIKEEYEPIDVLIDPTVQCDNMNDFRNELTETKDCMKDEFEHRRMGTNTKCEMIEQLCDVRISDEDERKSLITDGIKDETNEQFDEESSATETTYSPITRKGVRHIRMGSKYKCKYCEKTFTAGWSAKDHENTHTGKKPYECNICEMSFTHRNVLRYHLKRHNSNETTDEPPKRIKCKYCEKTFSRSSTVKDHENVHFGEQPYHCNECGRNFVYGTHYRSHLKFHASGGIKKLYQCDICGKSLHAKNRITEHMRLHSNECPYACDLCDSKFISSWRLSNHRKFIHKTGPPPTRYECNYCEKTFSRYGTAREHENIHTGESPHTCEDCGLSFRYKTTLRKHLRMHASGGIRKSYQCDICEKIMYSKKYVSQHMKLHTDAIDLRLKYQRKSPKKTSKLSSRNTRRNDDDEPRPIYKCKYCEKIFTRFGSMRDHEHAHRGERPYLCNYCGRNFTYDTDFKKHLRHHANGWVMKSCQCDICGKIVNSRKSLTQHMHLHSKQHPCVCNLCNSRFISVIKLIYHRKRFHGVNEGKVYNTNAFCSVCGKKFGSTNAVNAHMRKHIENRIFTCSNCGDTFKEVRELRLHKNKIHLDNK